MFASVRWGIALLMLCACFGTFVVSFFLSFERADNLPLPRGEMILIALSSFPASAAFLVWFGFESHLADRHAEKIRWKDYVLEKLAIETCEVSNVLKWHYPSPPDTRSFERVSYGPYGVRQTEFDYDGYGMARAMYECAEFHGANKPYSTVVGYCSVLTFKEHPSFQAKAETREKRFKPGDVLTCRVKKDAETGAVLDIVPVL